MAFEHRGFRVTVDVKSDATETQWLYDARIEGINEETREAALPGAALGIPKLKIDVLMALSMLEHKAVTSIDEWHAAQPALA